jgi:hypothetical protein
MPRLGWRLLHLLAIATLAITQPLLGILGDNPTFFTAHQATPGQVFWFALIVAVVPAALAVAIEGGVHLIAPSAGENAHRVLLGVFGFGVAIQVVNVLPGPWIVPVVVAAALAAGIVVLYLRFEAIRSVFSFLAITPALFLLLFLFASPASNVVFPDDVDAADLGEIDELIGEDLGVDGATLTVAERLNRRFPPIYLLILDELPMASLLDESGAIDDARFPNFARLADTSHLFTNATTIGLTTERAVPTILTGQAQSQEAPVYSLYPENLFTLLGDIYDASESDPLVNLCPPSICNGERPGAIDQLLTNAAATEAATTSAPTTTAAPRAEPEPDENEGLGLLLDDAAVVFGHLLTPDGLDVGLPEIGATWGDFGGESGAAPSPAATPSTTTTTTTTTLPLDVGAGEMLDDDIVPVDAATISDENTSFLDSLIFNDGRVRDFETELTTIRASDTPRLSVVHSLLPHVPWRFHGNGEAYADISLPGYFSMWDSDLAIARAGQQRHLLQLQFTDQLLGRYLDELERKGIFGSATVIVTADHGVSFVPGERNRGPGLQNVGGIAGVPLFYKLPNQHVGEAHNSPVQTIDIVPTIAEQLDLEIPWTVDGVSLFGPTVDRVRDILFPFHSPVDEPFGPTIEAVTTDLLEVFGNGTDGNLYALAGLRDRIGTNIDDLLSFPAAYCWSRERPDTLPEADGTVGFVFGTMSDRRRESIPYAIAVGAILAGTAMTLNHDHPQRVYGLGDPTVWADATLSNLTIYEIVDDRLFVIPEC